MAKITDLAAGLDIELFRGRTTVVEFTITGSSAMYSNVQVLLYYSGTRTPLSPQPTVAVAGRVIRVTFVVSLGYPQSANLLIKLDSQPEIWGTALFSTRTISAPSATPLAITINPSDSVVPVTINLVASTPGLGALRSLDGTSAERWNGTEWVDFAINTAPANNMVPYTIPFSVN